MSRGKPSSLHVLFAAAEVAPFSKVGGLGDVAASLPGALSGLGVEVTTVSPLHRSCRPLLPPEAPRIEGLSFDFGGRERHFDLVDIVHPRHGGRLLLVDAPEFFDLEDAIYGQARGESGLGDLRWLAFSALLHSVAMALERPVDVLHVHDWHAAAAVLLFRTDHAFEERSLETATLLTIHNAAFQGRLSIADWRRSGLREDLLSDWILLDHGEVNLLKGATIFADKVTTVSPGYAGEIVGAEGAGLAAVFESRGADLLGILNGIDTDEWDPSRDPEIPAHFDALDLSGKDRCRSALCDELGLEPTTGPVLAFIGRLTHQKGVDLLLEVLPRLLEDDATRFVALGTGDAELEAALQRAAGSHPGRMAFVPRFDPALSHRIEAGADLLVMPSRFEPCGLNQMISHRYGTIPIVRSTGGLADSVKAATGRRRNDADGFHFEKAVPADLLRAIQTAQRAFKDPKKRDRLRRNGMRRRHDWGGSAELYVEVYQAARAKRGTREREELLLSHLRIEPRSFEAPEHRRIPEWFEKDVVFLGVQGPRRVWVHWEVQGPFGKPTLEALTEDERYAARFEVRMIELDHGGRWAVEVQGLAKNWFIDVEPSRRYRAELWMRAPGHEALLMGRSGIVETPPEIPA